LGGERRRKKKKRKETRSTKEREYDRTVECLQIQSHKGAYVMRGMKEEGRKGRGRGRYGQSLRELLNIYSEQRLLMIEERKRRGEHNWGKG